MEIDPVRDAVRAMPFQPFVLRTVGGKEYRVSHPEFVAIIPKTRVAVVSDTGSGFEVLDISLIEAISFPEFDEKGAA